MRETEETAPEPSRGAPEVVLRADGWRTDSPWVVKTAWRILAEGREGPADRWYVELATEGQDAFPGTGWRSEGARGERNVAGR